MTEFPYASIDEIRETLFRLKLMPSRETQAIGRLQDVSGNTKSTLASEIHGFEDFLL